MTRSVTLHLAPPDLRTVLTDLRWTELSLIDTQSGQDTAIRAGCLFRCIMLDIEAASGGPKGKLT